MVDNEQCPCGSGLAYMSCCEQLHSGRVIAGSAKQLMRSRYSAFVKKRVNYLIATLHPSKRTPQTEVDIRQTMDSCCWVRLNILETQGGTSGDTEGIVEFIAAYETDSPGLLHERSRFRQEEGRWYYLDAIPTVIAKPGRNEPCWCGSGKKTKKCHGSV